MLPTPTAAKFVREDVQMVPTSQVAKYHSHNRRTEPWGSNMDELKADIQKNGVKEPIVLKYGTEDRKLHVWDGDHRILAAEELGIKELPVRVITAKKTDDGYGKPVAGYKGTGEVPEHLKPSEVGLKARPVKRSE